MPKNVGIWRVRLFGSQMPTARPIRNEHETDGHHELRDQGRAGEAPHQDSLDQRAEERRGDEHGDRERDERLDARG